MSKLKIRPGCAFGKDCDACEKFHCIRCRRMRPWCYGHGDAHPDWCNGCFYKRHKKSSDGKEPPCRICDKHDAA